MDTYQNRDDGLDRRRQNEFAQGLVAAGWYKIRAKVAGVEAMRWYAPDPELLPVCGMPDCSSETLPGGRFCADCDGLVSEGPAGVQSLTDRGIKIYVICPTCEREQALPPHLRPGCHADTGGHEGLLLWSNVHGR